MNNVRTVIADLLYAARPLLWAWFESRHYSSERSLPPPKNKFFSFHTILGDESQKLSRGWIVCLVMDLLSIRLLERNNNESGSNNSNSINNKYRNKNTLTEEELRRRKLRLFLYALRSPVWSTVTVPFLDAISRKILQRIPLLGNLVEAVLWDWVLYYQHPFISEEG